MITEGKGFSISWSVNGSLETITFGGNEIALPSGFGHVEIDGQPANSELLPTLQGFALTSGEASGTLGVTPGEEVSLLFTADLVERPSEDARSEGTTGGTESEGRKTIEQIGVTFGLPATSEIHLAEFYNVGRKLDSDMPVGESYEGKLAYGFLVFRAGTMWVRFRVDRHSMNGMSVRVLRMPHAFMVTLRWAPNDPIRIMPFDSLESSTADFASRLESEFSIKKRIDDPNIPAWVSETRLILTVDMMRSNSEITHDFADVTSLCEELDRAGCPRGTLLYIPGWQGAYDAVHPTYRPAKELGGESAFRKMIDAAHHFGYRVMIHTTGWGIDPYHEDIDELIKLAKKDADGHYQGWQIGYTRRPPRHDLGFVTGKVGVAPATNDGKVPDLAVLSPSYCEALFSVGGLRGSTARLRLTCQARSVTTPAGWFADHDEYDIPFPLLLEAGDNTVQCTFVEGSPPSSDFWYRIRYSFVPESPYSPWTWPILRADTSHPDYVRIFVENVSSVVKEFEIDAVHVDATTLGWPPSVRKLFYNLRDALPGIPINTELYTEFEGLGYWSFSQNSTQSLLAKRERPEEQQSLPVHDGLEELFAWLDKPSRICDFARDYIRTYPHLCAINAFVPVGKVCNTFPPRLMPPTNGEHWQVLRDADRLGYIPTLRVNFRQHGLDPETVKAITELTDLTRGARPS